MVEVDKLRDFFGEVFLGSFFFPTKRRGPEEGSEAGFRRRERRRQTKEKEITLLPEKSLGKRKKNCSFFSLNIRIYYDNMNDQQLDIESLKDCLACTTILSLRI